MDRHARNLEVAAELMAASGSLRSDMSPAEFAKFPTLDVEAEWLTKEMFVNPFSGETIRYERSPGNFASRKIGDKTFFCLYDQYGRELRIELPGKPTSQPTSAP